MVSSESSLFDDGGRDSTRKKRTIMCSQCRRDKQKCDPMARDWDAGQKCDRCVKLGYECGPPERAPRRSRKRSPDTSTSMDKVLQWHNHKFNDSVHSPLQFVDSASYCHSPQQNESTKLNAELSPNVCVDSGFAFPRVDSNNSCSPWTGGKLAILGDLFATREILRWELELCDQILDWLGLCESIIKVKAAIQGIIGALQEDFEYRIKKLRCTITRKTDPAMEITLLELYLIAYKFANPPRRAALAAEVDGTGDERGPSEQSSIQQMVYTLHQGTFAYSAADFMCTHVWKSSPCIYSASQELQMQVIECYQKASLAIGKVLARTEPNNCEHKEFLLGSPTDTGKVFGYPVAHLSIMHGPPLLYLELWKCPATRIIELDCLRRTPLHAAVYTSRNDELEHILENDPMAGGDRCRDAFGLTPLMVAVCKDNVKAVSLLLKYRADETVQDSRGRNILALAARNDSQNVLRLLLRRRVPPSSDLHAGELCEAIVHHQRDIVNILIEHYSKCSVVDEPSVSRQVEAGIIVARQKGSDDIAAALEALLTCQLAPLEPMLNYHQFLCSNPTTPSFSLNGSEQNTRQASIDSVVPPPYHEYDTMSWEETFPNNMFLDPEWVECASTEQNDKIFPHTVPWS